MEKMLEKMEKMDQFPFQEGKTAHQQVIDDNGLLFPMLLLPKENTDHDCNTLPSFLHTIQNNREWINDKLKHVGALVFRGFPLKTASDFNAVVEAFGWEEQRYFGIASRTRIEGRAYTANESPLHLPIRFHHEMSTFEEYPNKVVFFCEVAPPEGGQTLILLSHKVTKRMQEKYPELVKKIEKEGLMTQVVLPPEDDPENLLSGWKTRYKTEDKEKVEKMARNSGVKKSNVSWEGNNLILDMGPLDSIKQVEGDKKSWFNMILFGEGEQALMVGDGSEVPKEAIRSCLKIAEEECFETKWEVGDVVVIDNTFVMHARRPSKPPRRILAAVCK